MRNNNGTPLRERDARRANRSRTIIASGALAIAGLLGGVGFGLHESDARHVSQTEFSQQYGENGQSNRDRVTSTYMERLAAGEDVAAIKGANFWVTIETNGSLQNIEVSNPIAMEDTVDGQNVRVGYLGISQPSQESASGYVAVFVSPDTKLEHNANNDKGNEFELNGTAYVDAYLPSDHAPWEYTMVYNGSADRVTMQVGAAPSQDRNTFLINTVGNATHEGTSELSVAGTHRQAPNAQITGLPDSIASVRIVS